MNVDVTPILVAMVYALVPTLAVFAVGLAWREIRPLLVKYLGEKNATLFQARVNQLLDKAISYGVAEAVGALQSNGGIAIDAKSFVMKLALQYAKNHAGDLAAEAGQLEEKILARFAGHADVQQLYGPSNDNAGAPLEATLAPAKAA